ncbi:MAG: glycosyltransferase, partial [Salinibacterium sp.]|nr:glycosyltransferase [Salinibacterium sp.]
GRGRDASAYSAMLGGLRQAITEYNNVRLFIELRGRADHEIWRQLLRLDLLDRTSTFPSVVSVHTLVAQCDALLFPERYGEIHSIMLESMRDGVPLVVSADPALAGIIDASTAAMVDEPTVEQWSQQLRRLLGHPEEAADRAVRAAQRVRSAFRRDRQIEILVETFERMLHGEAYSFDGSSRAGLSDETRPA